MIVSGVESPYECRFLRSLELAVHILVITTALTHNSKPAVLPEHSLGAEPMRRLDNGHEHGRADRAQGRNRTEQFQAGCFLLSARSSCRACWRKGTSASSSW